MVTERPWCFNSYFAPKWSRYVNIKKVVENQPEVLNEFKNNFIVL